MARQAPPSRDLPTQAPTPTLTQAPTPTPTGRLVQDLARRPGMTRTPAHRPMTHRLAAALPKAPWVAALPSATRSRWPASPARHPSAQRSRSARSLAPALPRPGCSCSRGRCSPGGRRPGRPAQTRPRSGVASPAHRPRHLGSRTAPWPRPAPPTSRPRQTRAVPDPDASRPAAGETSGTGNARSGQRRAAARGPSARDRTGTPAWSRRHPGRLVQLPRGRLEPGSGRLHHRGTIGAWVLVRSHAAGPLRGSYRAGPPWTGTAGPRWPVKQLQASSALRCRASPPLPLNRPVSPETLGHAEAVQVTSWPLP
jgi:hypothetical protein